MTMILVIGAAMLVSAVLVRTVREKNRRARDRAAHAADIRRRYFAGRNITFHEAKIAGLDGYSLGEPVTCDAEKEAEARRRCAERDAKAVAGAMGRAVLAEAARRRAEGRQ